jgi:hypothetical protein
MVIGGGLIGTILVIYCFPTAQESSLIGRSGGSRVAAIRTLTGRVCPSHDERRLALVYLADRTPDRISERRPPASPNRRSVIRINLCGPITKSP